MRRRRPPRRAAHKTDLVLVAEILGHARLEITPRYSLPSGKDGEDALKLITVDR
jgi:integrase/recombinase XerC